MCREDTTGDSFIPTSQRQQVDVICCPHRTVEMREVALTACACQTLSPGIPRAAPVLCFL